MKTTFLFVFAFSVLSLPISASEWNCRNYDMEISCNQGKCESAEKGEFTPLDVYIKDSGNVTIGAYTGTWNGTGEVMKNGNHFVVAGNELRLVSGTGDIGNEFLIAVNTKTNIAIFQVDPWAMPMTCDVRKSEALQD